MNDDLRKIAVSEELRGWVGRIRTQKCQFEEPLEMSGPFRKVRGQRLFASERLEGGRTRLGWVRQNSNRALVPAPTPTPPAGTNSPGRIGANWIGASKQKGIWVGGPVPLGYASIAKKLAVVPEEADIVRMIFTRYIALGSVRALAQELQNGGIRTKQRTLPNGRTIGGGWVRGRRPGTASTLARSSIAGKSFAAVRRPFSTPPFRGRSGKAVGTSGRAALHSSRHTCTSHRAPFRPGRPPDDADPYQQKRGPLLLLCLAGGHSQTLARIHWEGAGTRA